MNRLRVALYTVAVMSTWLQLGAVLAGVYRRRRFFFDTLQRGARYWGMDAQRGLAVCLAILLTFARAEAGSALVRTASGYGHEALMHSRTLWRLY